MYPGPGRWYSVRMTRFREHRGGLADSMATTVEVHTRAELIAHIKKLLSLFDVHFRFDEIEVKPYGGYDERIGWNNHIVTMPDYGVLGFTDGPI